MKHCNFPQGVAFQDQGLWERRRKMPVFYRLVAGGAEMALQCWDKINFSYQEGWISSLFVGNNCLESFS